MTERTQMQKELNFTLEQGLEVQRKQLDEFKSVLTVGAFAALEREATKDNHKATDGFDVVRGNQLDEALHNVVMPLFRST